MMIETLAKIETARIQAEKRSKSNLRWKVALTLLTAAFPVLLKICLELIK